VVQLSLSFVAVHHVIELVIACSGVQACKERECVRLKLFLKMLHPRNDLLSRYGALVWDDESIGAPNFSAGSAVDAPTSCRLNHVADATS